MAKATPIPTGSRSALAQRDRGRCVNCGGASSAWHHRRTREVRDEHTHHPGNGVSLCQSCHDWAHANPTQARVLGLIVSRHEEVPCDMAFRTFYGWVIPQCTAPTLQVLVNKFTPTPEEQAS